VKTKQYSYSEQWSLKLQFLLVALSCYTTGKTNYCDDAVLDLYLIVDSSKSIEPADFEKAKIAIT
jgi:hypothetical protein